MSEKLLNTEDSIDSAPEDRKLEGLNYLRNHLESQTKVTTDDKGQASHEPGIDFGEASDGGLRAWLVAVWSIHG
ncbi:hypothetical protein AZE42_13947 [Rhizopogon vesiculosus]|uniref:Uncharacterized protein n=1 Tax=Rhizopogon vesiculosus TaxID=180088 RepID=A0A1J8QBC5_9AGAM|nr:hypothetical protein AZE42_13947 [Rhizopogon vesiculosus]